MPDWIRNHSVKQAAGQRRTVAAARVQRIQAAQAKLAVAKQKERAVCYYIHTFSILYHTLLQST